MEIVHDRVVASTVPVDVAAHLGEVAGRLRAIDLIVRGDGLEDVTAEERLYFVGELTSWARLHLSVVHEWAPA